MPPLLYDSGSWRSTLEVKSLSLNASSTTWEWLMKVNTGSEITVIECLPYYMTEAHDGQQRKWNHSTWMPPLPYDRDSWRSKLEVKSLSLNAFPTMWQSLMKVNSGNEITVFECLPYYMTVAHEGKNWKWNHCPWMPPILYDSGSCRSIFELKSLSLNAPPTLWKWLMKVNTGNEITVLEFTPTIWQWIMNVPTRSEITVLECLPYYMTVAHEGQYWKWNHCPWIPPLLYNRNTWRSTLEVKSLSLNASSTIW